MLAYFISALKNLPRRRERVEITLDDHRPLRRRVKTVMIANMGKITGGLEAVPTASPNDGRLDVALLRAETLAQWLRLLGYALLGRAHEDPSLDVYQARKIVIRTPFPQPVEFDGEEAGRTRELTVEVVPKAVRVLVPPGAPAAQDAAGPPAALARQRGRWHVLAPVLVALAAGAALWTWRRRDLLVASDLSLPCQGRVKKGCRLLAHLSCRVPTLAGRGQAVAARVAPGRPTPLPIPRGAGRGPGRGWCRRRPGGGPR